MKSETTLPGEDSNLDSDAGRLKDAISVPIPRVLIVIVLVIEASARILQSEHDHD